jgi:sec-independent protein translocase protein TatA
MVYPLFLNLGSGEIFLIVLVIILFFGSDKLPEMVRTFGRGMKEMKNATSELQREIQNSTAEIQRDMNIEEHVKDLKETTEDLGKRIMEGASVSNTESDIIPEQPQEPEGPEDSIKR